MSPSLRDSRDFCGLVAVSEASRLFSIRRSEEWEFLLKVGGMFGRSDGHRDLFSISEDGNWDVFVGG